MMEIALASAGCLIVGFLIGKTHTRAAMRDRLAKVHANASTLYEMFSVVAAENDRLLAERREKV